MKDFMIRCLFLMAFLSMAVGCGKYELEISPYYNWCDNYPGKRFVLNTTRVIQNIIGKTADGSFSNMTRVFYMWMSAVTGQVKLVFL